MTQRGIMRMEGDFSDCIICMASGVLRYQALGFLFEGSTSSIDYIFCTLVLIEQLLISAMSGADFCA